MRSVGWALTWEFWRRRRLYIILTPIVLAFLIYLIGLRFENNEQRYLQIKESLKNLKKMEDLLDYPSGGYRLQENLREYLREYKSRMNEIYHLFIFYLIFFLGITVISETNKIKIGIPQRLFTLPLSTQSIVFRIYLVDVIFLMIFSCVFTGFFIYFSEKTVSIFGISLFTTTTIITIRSFLWLTISAPILGIPLLLVMSLSLFLWFASQHGSIFFSDMNMIWEDLEPRQALFMFSCLILSYIVAVKAVALKRVKENLSISEINELLDHKIRSVFIVSRGKFKSSIKAQFWFEWQRNGFLMPFIILLFVVEFVILFSIEKIPPASIFDIFNFYFFIILIFLSLFWGMLIAKTNHARNNFRLWSFEATRPLSSRDLSYAILKNGAVNMLLTGVILIFGVIFAVALNYFLGNASFIKSIGNETLQLNPLNIEIKGIRVLIFAFSCSMIISWILVGLSSIITLLGWKPFWVLFWIISCSLAFIFYYRIAIPWYVFNLLWEILFPVLGKVLILEIAFSFIIAFRRDLIQKKDILTNLALWVLGSIILVLICYSYQPPNLDLVIFVSGIIALSLAPFALAPLALHWNRHR